MVSISNLFAPLIFEDFELKSHLVDLEFGLFESRILDLPVN